MKNTIFYTTGPYVFKQGQKVFVKYLVGDDPDNVLKLIDPYRGLYEFTTDAVAYIEDMHSNWRTMKHLRFVRRLQNKKPNRKVQKWPKLRIALQFLNKQGKGPKRIHVPGGFRSEIVIGYDDEILIADYSTSGAYGWIVPKKDIDWILNSLPPLVDSGIIKNCWLGLAHDGKHIVYGIQNDPNQEQEKEFSIFRILYDESSLLVKNIIGPHGKEFREVWYSQREVVRKEGRLPRKFRPRDRR